MITRGLNSGQKYYYVVRAVASDGTYADSDEDSCTTSANVIPWNGTAAQIVQQA